MAATIKTKEYHSLFWEYLKRSNKYKMFCKTFNGVSPMELLASDILSNFARNNKINPIIFINYYMKFGNVHTDQFENWWNKKKQDLTSLKLIVSDLSTDNTFLFDLSNLILSIHHQCRNKTKFSLVDLSKIRERIQNYFLNADPNTIYLKFNVGQKINFKIYSSAVKKLIEERNNILPIPEKSYRLRAAELRDYLLVYDLWKQGLTYRAIIEKIGSKKEKNNSKDRGLWQSYIERKKHVEKIITNIENGKFPGDYN